MTSEIEDAYPLSPLQQGMLFHNLLHPGHGVDVEQLLCDLREDLDGPAFQRAWRNVVARHPVLRTGLRWENLAEPRQEVHARVELPWFEHDWRLIPGSERERRFDEWLADDRRRGFDLPVAPLFRLTLLRFADAEFRLVWTFHHAVLEGRSYRLLLQEIFAFYEALRHGAEFAPPLPRPYRDYIDWLQQQDFGKDEAYWRRTLKGFTAPTPLVVDHARDGGRDSARGHGHREVLLSEEITSALRKLARENQFNLNTLVQGAWALLLSRYSGETDVVFGGIRSNRRSTIEGADAMIGLFLNTLPLRVRVDADALLLPWLREVRQQWLAMRGHEHAPLASVQKWSEVPAGSPLFHSTMMFETYHLDTLLRQQGGAWANRGFRLLLQTNYPLDLAAYDGVELCLRIDFDRSRIEHSAAARMLDHVRTLLEAIAVDAQRKLADLPMLTAAERDRLLFAWNRTAADYPRGLCLHGLFEAQVERTPEAVAIACEGSQLTYGELNRLANRLAHQLAGLGVGPDVLVGVCAERSLEMVVGLLAVLKAGGAYVPIDPAYPAERVAFMLSDSGTSVVLVQEHLIGTLPAIAATVVCLDTRALPGAAANPARAITDENLAYVIYTSGSTGLPKGAMIPHRAIVNHLQWMQATFPLGARDCVLQKTEFSFDVSVWEFFAPLAAGARLVLARPGGHRDPAYLIATIARDNVTMLQVVPSLLRMLVEMPAFGDCRSLRHVLCGGEVMAFDTVRRFYAIQDAQLHNLYGPTETAIDALHYAVPRDFPGGSVPIGRPVANTQAYVLDAQRQPVPLGVPGELYLGGIQVGRGYHRQPRLTAERFVADGFSAAPGARLYKTGDTVRFRHDGNIEFLGRVDRQVKMRGFRIELGEIEAALQQHPVVREAVVLLREDVPGDQRLVAYATSTSSSPALAAELRGFMQHKLPAYMVPSALVFPDAFPLTPNGKVDRAALPPPDGTSTHADESPVPPRTALEKKVLAIWREFFKLEHIGIRDDFFDLGGDSLMVVGMLGEINRTLGVDVGVPEFFRNPTVEQLASAIGESRVPRKRRAEVVRLQDGRADPPVYFIYAGPDEFRLAQLIDADHPVFGIDVKWPLAWRNAVVAYRRAAFPDMAQLAAPYAAALIAHARTSSCVLAGHSFTGLIAFEVARQFEEQGGKVEMVVLLDTWARYPTPVQIAWHNLLACWQRSSTAPATAGGSQSISARLTGSWLVVRRLLGKKKKELRAFLKRTVLDGGKLTTVSDDEGVPLSDEILQRLYVTIEAAYRPRLLNARGILFRADSMDEKKALRAADGSLGWKDCFAGGLEVISATGDHLSMIREHHPALARALRAVLKRHWPGRQDETTGSHSR